MPHLPTAPPVRTRRIGALPAEVALAVSLCAAPVDGRASTATPAEIAAEIPTALARCATARHPLPALDPSQREALARGEVVRMVHHGDPELPSTAVGVALLDASLDALWIAAQDPHAEVDPALAEFVVESLGSDHALWYGHLDLPRPLKDRQWVVESSNNHALAQRGCWEHGWTLVPDGLPRARAMVAAGSPNPNVTLDEVDDAIFTPMNDGSWLMVPMPDGRVLVGYQATSVVGGAIPDWLVLQLSMSRLESVLRDLETRARTWAPSHYRAGHAPVPGGGGDPIPTFTLSTSSSAGR